MQPLVNLCLQPGRVAIGADIGNSLVPGVMHAKHGLDCANEVYAALAAIDARGDCAKQQAEANAAFATIIDEYNELDIQYDDETNHGATMGAVFPP